MSTQDSNSSVSNQDQPSEQPNGDNNMSAQDSNSSVSNPYQPSEQPNGDNNNEQAEGNEFPTRYTCPIEGDPPVHAVTFGITDETLSHWGQEAGGPSQGPSDQVFEYATLHRYISHMGILHAYRDVTHPITGRAIRRDRALNCVSDVSPSIQARITNERRLRGLPMEVEGLNLTPEDMTRMQVTSRRVQSRTVDPQEVVWSPFEGTPREVRQMNQGVAAPPPLDSLGSDSDDSILQDPPPGLRNVRRRLNNDGRRVQMCGFINGEGTIRSAAHAAALIGVLQLARSAPGGIAASLGHSNRGNWIRTNLPNPIFSDDGPCNRFIPIGFQTFARHLRAAQTLAVTIINRDHSNEQSGAGGESIPEWARQFTVLLEEQQNQQARNNRTLQARAERTGVTRSLIGAQAPLDDGGPHDTSRPAQLRTETSRNNGDQAMRQQVIGNVEVESVSLMEGRDDSSNRRPAPTRRMQNGTRRRNVHLAGSFSPDGNDPTARFANVQSGFQSLDALTTAVTQSLYDPPPPPPRTLIDIMREFNEVREMMNTVPNDPSQFPNRTVYRRVLSAYAVEIGRFGINVGDESDHDESDHESNSIGF